MTRRPINPIKIPSRLLAGSFFEPEYFVPLLERRRLIDNLEDALRCRLIEIRAPTGCGKTTILHQWHRHLLARGIASAWLSILRSDLDVADFLSSIAWALHIAGMDHTPKELLEAAHERIHATDSLVNLLAKVAAFEGLVVLLIDDFHLLQAPNVLALADTLLSAAPPNLRVVITTRAAPGLSIARLQMRGLVHTLVTEELLFSPDEALAVLRTDMSPQDASKLLEHTEGWPIAVQLARLWFRQRPRGTGDLAGFPGHTGNVATYLTNQVIGSLEEDLRDFLIDTSILTRITPELADAVRASSDSRSLLSRLRAFEPLLVPIAGAEDAYRLHALLAEHLRRMLRHADPGRFARMNRCAAIYLAANDRLVEAVRHAKLSADRELPCRLIAACDPIRECVLRAPREMRACLALLDEREWECNSRVWLTRIFLLWRDGRFAEAAAQFEEVEAHYGGSGRLYARDSVVVRVALSRCEPAHSEQILADCERQLAEHGAEDDLARAMLDVLTAIFQVQMGRLDNAQRALDNSRCLFERPGSPITRLHVQLHIGWIAATRGDLPAARQLLRAMCRSARRFGPAERGVLTLARAYLLGIEYELAQVEFAPGEISSFLQELEQAFVWFDFFVTAYRAAIEIAFQREGSGEALALVARGRAAASALNLEESAERVLSAMEASVLTRSGEAGAAQRRLAQIVADEHAPQTWYEFDALMFATAVTELAVGRNGRALGIAFRWMERSGREGRRCARCRATLISAIAHRRAGAFAAADEAFREVLGLAGPQSLLAPFLEHGPDVRTDIEALMARVEDPRCDPEKKLMAQLRQAFTRGPQACHALARLSEREREVLEALRGRESNKHIARRLKVSEHAVKFHVKNIFRKLGVHSRQAAVDAAHTLS